MFEESRLALFQGFGKDTQNLWKYDAGAVSQATLEAPGFFLPTRFQVNDLIYVTMESDTKFIIYRITDLEPVTLEQYISDAGMSGLLEDLNDVSITNPINGEVLTYSAGNWVNAPGGGGGAPTVATYITQTPNADLTNEQALSLLATGILKSTTGTGVVSIAVAGTDYYAPGNVIPVADGGTNATTALDARASLGLVIGTDVQAYFGGLQQIGSLAAPADDKILFYDFSANAYEYLSLGTNISISGTTLNVTGAVSDGDKGDITVSSSGSVWTIDNTAVTYAKIQNTAGASVLIGRGDSGAGSFQEIALGTNLSMSGTTLNATGGGGVDLGLTYVISTGQFSS
jgi:hypothetical protein